VRRFGKILSDAPCAPEDFPIEPNHRSLHEGARLQAEAPYGELRAQDHWRVNLGEPWEIRFWTRELGCGEEELRRAARAAGDIAGSVRAWLSDASRREGETNP
jgi:hypothetical protein